MMTQGVLWAVAGAAVAVLILAMVAERFRARRRNLDSPGWVPWMGIQVGAILVAFLAAALAVKG